MDLLYSLLLLLMVMVLVLGAFVIREQRQGNYVVALAQALLVTAGILLALGWLWDPRGGFAGIGQIMNRYFMSVGMPFERWMHSLANLAEQERDPDKFVMAATQDMSALPWVSGIDWQTQNERGMAGIITRHATDVRLGGIRLTLYTRWSPSPTLALHVRDEVLGLRGMNERERIGFVNAHVRTISRVVVHPQFRAVGLAVAVVRCLIEHCDTRYVEALAVMGRAHPFFEKAGMRRVDQGAGRPVYYWWERSGQ